MKTHKVNYSKWLLQPTVGGNTKMTLKQEFDILIIMQGRVLSSILIFSALFIPILLVCLEIENQFSRWTTLVFGLVLLLVSLIYYSVGRLTVTSNDGVLHFTWKKKLVFNYEAIPDIEIGSIKRLVIDDGLVLRKIVTENHEITLGHNKPSRLLKTDAQKFITFLKKTDGNFTVVDSWDVLFEKGYGKVAYWINLIAITFILISTSTYIFINGFGDPRLAMVLAPLGMLFSAHVMLRNKRNTAANKT